jgi:hypothetical protein
MTYRSGTTKEPWKVDALGNVVGQPSEENPEGVVAEIYNTADSALIAEAPELLRLCIAVGYGSWAPEHIRPEFRAAVERALNGAPTPPQKDG